MPKKRTLDITNKNVIEVESLDFGEFTIILEDDQVRDMLERGAKVLVDFREDMENNLEDIENIEDREDWYLLDDLGAREDGVFRSEGIDWNSIFPDIDSDEFENTINCIFSYSNKNMISTLEVLTVLGVGIASSMGANTGPLALGMITVCEISGPFFDSA